MNDTDAHHCDFGLQSFDDMGPENMLVHRRNDYGMKYKPEKCISSHNMERRMTSPWYDEPHKLDKDARYPQQDLSRDSQYDTSMNTSEISSRDRDLPPFDPTFEKRSRVSSSNEIEVTMSLHDSKKRLTVDVPEEDSALKIKKQRVSPTFPVDDDKDLNDEALNGYRSLSILQSWSSGTLMSDKQHAVTSSHNPCVTLGDHAEDGQLDISREFIQPFPHAEPGLLPVTSQDNKLTQSARCQSNRSNFFLHGEKKSQRSFASGSNVQQLLHVDRVNDLIGDWQGRSAWSSHSRHGWESDEQQWRLPNPHIRGYCAFPINQPPWDRDRYYPYPQQHPPYALVDHRSIHARSYDIPYHPPAVYASVKPNESILILALPEDRASLSEILCLVRENIEVFAATDNDIKAPAPGRKRAVFEGQVGLRCIHCRWSANQHDRVKRAVCYPSSLQRIYRTIIDMKLDHFKACKYVPFHLKMKLDELMCSESRSTGTTMQYMVWGAKKLGMVDSEHGIRFSSLNVDMKSCLPTSTLPKMFKQSSVPQTNAFLKRESVVQPHEISKFLAPEENGLSAVFRATSSDTSVSKPSHDYDASSLLENPCMIQDVSFSLSMNLSFEDGVENIAILKESKSVDLCTPIRNVFHGKVALALPEDRTSLTPLRCFLRQNVCAFSATSEDVVDRSATTIVTEGQVGVACLHCMKLPSKDRSNRSMCFPFTISRIYQAVADIQRFHFTECKMIPHEVKQQFIEYQSLSAKGSKGLATRQYWITSAEKLGLIDTPHGIRFSRDPSLPMMKEINIDSDIDESDRSPLVLPEDKGTIAEFLYLTMLQLKPCRFKEADRNKRRLKDVGCKGVECRHCAGLVDGRKFFWSSVNAVESNFVSVHTHMTECKMVPQPLRDELMRLKALRKEQTSRLKNGSQKAFFSRVWQRLHPEGSNDIPSTPSSPVRFNAHTNEGRFTYMPRVTPSQATVYDNTSLYRSISPTGQHVHINDPRNFFRLHSDVYDLSVPRMDSIEADDGLQTVE